MLALRLCCFSIFTETSPATDWRCWGVPEALRRIFPTLRFSVLDSRARKPVRASHFLKTRAILAIR